MTVLAKLERVSQLNDDEHNLLTFMAELKTDGLMLINDGLAAGLKIANDGVVKSFKSSYPSYFS